MLGSSAMLRLLAATVALAAVVPSVAAADTYVGLGIGPSLGFSGDHEQASQYEGDGRHLKVIGGMRWGQFSAEASIGGFGLFYPHNGETDGYQATASGKFNYPLTNGFEAFGRAGLHRTWINGMVEERYGNGWLIGAGFEYRVKLPVASGSIFVDYQIQRTAVTSDIQVPEYNLTSRMWTLGVIVGL